MISTITPLLEAFSEQNTGVKDELLTYATCDPVGFRSEALPLVKEGDEAARRYVFGLLLKHARLAEYLSDPSQSNDEEAAAIGRAALQLGVAVDVALERILTTVIRPRVGANENTTVPIINRIIDLFSTLLLGKVILRFQKELMAHPDTRVASKAVGEIVRAGRGPALVAQLLLQGDPRVQANAVEALWGMNDKNAKSVLLIAARSPHNRVAANGLVGLYRLGALESIPQLIRMAAHPNAVHRASAVWAIGETGDPRFLPFLNREFGKSEGNPKTEIIRALSRIRKQIRSAEGQLHVTLRESRILPDGARRIVVALSGAGDDLSTLAPTQFAIWEDSELVTQYSTHCVASPPILILGFGIPRFASIADPYAEAVSVALNACTDLKRGGDPWCLERYLVDDESRAVVNDEIPLTAADHHSPLALHKKTHRGFLIDPAFVREVIHEPGPRERASLDVSTVIEKLVDTVSRHSGTRHLFIFFDPRDIAAGGIKEGSLRRLTEALREEPVILHGFAPSSGQDFPALRELCAATNNGTFQSVAEEQLPQAVTETYLALLDRYEIVYRGPNSKALQPHACEMKVWSRHGTGALTFS